MVDTPRTAAYLKASIFQDGQAAGSITPQDLRDFVETVTPNIAGIDDPTNTTGLGAPAIIRGTVYAHKAPGVVMGMGQTTGTRQANATALQAAINYASTSGKFFEIIPGSYEINSSTGLYIPAKQTGFVWRGSKGGGDPNNTNSGYGGSQIIQYYNSGSGAPVLTIGDLDPNSTANANNYDIDGLHVRYGLSQAGKTSAQTLVIRGAAFSRYNNIGVQAGGSYYVDSSFGFGGYDGIAFSGGGLWFSNSMRDIVIMGCQHTYFKCENWSTGNVVENLYMAGGGNVNTYVPMTGNFMELGVGFGWGETVFDQVNCEWAVCNQAVVINSGGGVVFNCLHFEGVKFSGLNPRLIQMYYSSAHINTCNIVDLVCLQASMSGKPVIFSHYPYQPSTLHVTNLGMAANNTGNIDLSSTNKILIYHQGLGETTAGSGHGHFSLEKAQINTTKYGAYTIVDPYMQQATGRFTLPGYINRYDWGFGGSKINGALIDVSATYTHYAQINNATIRVPEVITSFTLTLSNRMANTGTQPPASGQTVHILRSGYSNTAGTLTVANHNGTTLTTTVDWAVVLHYVFDGTNWVAYTPVDTSPLNG